MKKELLGKLKLSISIIISLAIFLSILLSKNSADLTIGAAVIPSVSIKGVLQAFMMLSCISMILVNRKWGTVISIVLFSLYIAQMLMVIFVLKIMTSLPGLVNALLSLSIIVLVSSSLKKIEKNSITDVVTGMYNREGFTKEVEALSHKKKRFHVLIIRINNVRSVVDNLGYEYRELLIQEIGNRIRELSSGKGICGKLDGREFAVALPEPYNAELFARDLIDALEQKLTLNYRGVSTDCYPPSYVGIAEYPKDSSDVSQLIRFAGVAMTHAQRLEEDHIQVYDQTLISNLEQYAQMEKLIKMALDGDYFYLNYQPQFTTRTHKLRGFEALLRMKMPDGTIVSPGEFIPVAENSNLIMGIDSYVMCLAMSQFKEAILDKGADIIMSINVSAKSMSGVDFVSTVKQILENTGFPPKNLEIEITEYSFAKSMEQTKSNIHQLKKLGIMIALDDFGTGYTSLSQLLHLPIDLLKIDKSLVDDITTNKTNQDFVDSIIYMGHLMGCEVITEGVEQEMQLRILDEHKCDFIQGFIWGKPIPYNEALELIDLDSKQSEISR